MKYNILFILPLLTLATAPCHGQGCKGVYIANENIKIENVRVESMGKKVTLAMTVNLDKLKMGANNQFVLTPTITTENGKMEMPKMVINGRRQHIMKQRNERKAKADEAYVVRRENGKPQQIEYLQSMSYDKKLGNYRVSISEDLCGCGDSLGNNQYELAVYQRPKARFVRPEVVAEKIQELSKTAYIDFPVNRTELNPQYRRNPEQLDSIVRTIDALKADKNISVVGINIHGFASPEGRYESNDRLAQGRAQTLTEFVQRMVKLDKNIFTVSHTAEDWEGLRKFIAHR